MTVRVGFFADGGSTIGLGHLGRCAALAQAFAFLGARCEFLDASPGARRWLKARGLRCAPAGARGFDLVVGDSYRLTKAGWSALKTRGRRLLILDDFASLPVSADLVLNANAYARSLRWKKSRGSRRLLGPAYLPLRREYWSRPKARRIAGGLRRVLVTLGGAAPAETALAIAKSAAETLPRAEILVLVGPLARAGVRTPGARIRLLKPLPGLKPLLRRVDAVVCAGGQSLYEAAACGVPATAYLLAANQGPNLAAMTSAGCALGLGRYSRAGLAARLGPALRRLDSDPPLRRRMSRAGRALVDGRGALRAARAALALLS